MHYTSPGLMNLDMNYLARKRKNSAYLCLKEDSPLLAVPEFKSFKLMSLVSTPST